MLPGTDIIPLEQAPTLAGLLRERVQRSPEEIAYVHHDAASDRWLETSWRQVATAVAQWQAALSQEALQPGDRVALMLGNRPEWVFFDMAAAGLGLVTVPLYTNDRAENIRHILDDAGVKLLLLENPEQWQGLEPIADFLAELPCLLILEPLAAETSARQPKPVARWLPQAGGDLQVLSLPPDTLATVVYTSGTTGRPKGVMLSHRNILWDTQASLRLVPAVPQDIFLSFLPLSHTLERIGGYYLPMMSGATVAYARSIPLLAEDLRLIKPTVIIAVPRIFERVYARIQAKLDGESALARHLFAKAVATGWRLFEHEQSRAGWSPMLALWPLLDRLVSRKIRDRLGGRLRVAVCGGAPLSPTIARFFISLGIPLVQGYGLTESSPVVSVNAVEDNIPESVGAPLPGVEVRIGAQDELLTRSPAVMLGYWNQPEATADIIDGEGWLHTGDQARLERGHIFITGRLKEVIVLANGENVSPADMEIAIVLDRLFSQALVIGEGRPYLALLVVLDSDAYGKLAAEQGLTPDLKVERLNLRLEDILTEHVATQLKDFPGYCKIPRVAVVEAPWTIEEGLMTPTMKLRRNRILRRHQAEVERLYAGHV